MRVGTRFTVIPKDTFDEDHPHACGDKNFVKIRHADGKGSSPCVWGQANTYKVLSLLCRIIPMRVGTRKGFRIFLPLLRDHPHACGDKR